MQEVAQPIVDTLKSVGETLISPFTTMFKSPEEQSKEDAQKPGKDYGQMAEDQLLSDELKQSLTEMQNKDSLDDGFGR